MATQANLDAVQKLYIAYLGRPGDQAGLNFWADAIESGTSTLDSVATGFTLTTEYTDIYGDLTPEALVEQVYQNTFGRASDSEGKAFWVSLLNSGNVSAETIALQMIANTGDADSALVDKKVVASNTYTQAAGDNYDVTAAKTILTDINAGVGVDPNPPSTPVTEIASLEGRDTITLDSGAYQITIAAGTPASDDYQPQVGTPESDDYQPQVGTPASEDYQPEVGTPASEDYQPQIGTPASDDYEPQVGTPASEDYQPQVGTPASEDYRPQVGTPASEDYQPQVGTPASEDYQAQIGTPASEDYEPQVGTPASEDYQPAVGDPEDPDYQPQVGTPASDDYRPQVGTPASDDYQAQVGTPASDDYRAQVGTPASDDYEAQVGTPASEDYQAQIGTPASEDYRAQVGTPASEDYQAQIGTPASDDYEPQVGTPASDDYQPQVGTPASDDYQPAVGTPAVASASAPTDDGYDIISGFKIDTDKLDLPETTILTGVFTTEQTGNSLSITTNNDGLIEFGNVTSDTTLADKVSALLTAIGTSKATAAFVSDNDTYVVQGDGVAGVQSSDILIQLAGVNNVTQVSNFIV